MENSDIADWKVNFCSECNFCIRNRCRKRPPTGNPKQYPKIGIVPACSEFVKRREGFLTMIVEITDPEHREEQEATGVKGLRNRAEKLMISRQHPAIKNIDEGNKLKTELTIEVK